MVLDLEEGLDQGPVDLEALQDGDLVQDPDLEDLQDGALQDLQALQFGALQDLQALQDPEDLGGGLALATLDKVYVEPLIHGK